MANFDADIGGLILASGSPRRKQILSLLDIPFQVMIPEGEEKAGDLPPEELVKVLSAQKGREIAEKLRQQEIDITQGKATLILAADTVVALEGEVFGKPKDRQDAERMLMRLSGREHEVFTGVYITCVNADAPDTEPAPFPISFADRTLVRFVKLDKEEIHRYTATKEPYDKAGAYAVQGLFAPYIEGLHGDYYNVMGLPLSAICQQLKKAGVDLSRLKN